MKFTIQTQLHLKNNAEIIDYFERVNFLYAKIKREVYHNYKYIKRKDIDDKKYQVWNKSKYNTYLQKKYNISKRTANSIINDAISIYNLNKEQSKYQLKVINKRIKKLNQKIKILEAKVNNNKIFIKQGIVIDYAKHSQNKASLYYQRNKLHKLLLRKESLEYQIKSGNYKICFGNKKLLKQDKNKFMEKRDNQLFYIGSKDESKGNQQLQLTYNNKNNQFDIKLRTDYITNIHKYLKGKCFINYQKNKIIDILKHKNSYPLTYKILKKHNRYYLYIIFEIDNKKENILTRNNKGSVGIDFNKGHIDYVEINKYGDLLNKRTVKYRFGQSNKTKNDFYKIANMLCDIALNVGKDIVIEDLDFTDTKSKSNKAKLKKDKDYNRMLNSLAYSKFTRIMETVTYRRNVGLNKVNPVNTSKIGKQKFAEKMKLNIHQAASYVISRRNSNFKDEYIVATN